MQMILQYLPKRDLDTMDDIEDSDEENSYKQPDATQLFLLKKLPNKDWNYTLNEPQYTGTSDPDEEEYGTTYSVVLEDERLNEEYENQSQVEMSEDSIFDELEEITLI